MLDKLFQNLMVTLPLEVLFIGVLWFLLQLKVNFLLVLFILSIQFPLQLLLLLVTQLFRFSTLFLNLLSLRLFYLLNYTFLLPPLRLRLEDVLVDNRRLEKMILILLVDQCHYLHRLPFSALHKKLYTGDLICKKLNFLLIFLFRVEYHFRRS